VLFGRADIVELAHGLPVDDLAIALVDAVFVVHAQAGRHDRGEEVAAAGEGRGGGRG